MAGLWFRPAHAHKLSESRQPLVAPFVKPDLKAWSVALAYHARSTARQMTQVAALRKRYTFCLSLVSFGLLVVPHQIAAQV